MEYPLALHRVETGRGGGGQPPVVLLHGFPEFWYAWRHQLPALAAAGLRALAPDLRGYNLSPKPPAVRDYRVELVAGDVAALIRDECGGRAHVVGHDWGGIVAWWLAMHHPDLVDRLVVLNAPHPAAYLRELRRPAQALRSWYVLFFQLPWLPEFCISLNGYAPLRRMLRTDPARPDAFTPGDVERYVRALSQPRALTCPVNYYRAAVRQGPGHLAGSLRVIEAPALLIWGERDRYLVPRLTRGLGRWVPNLRVERLPRASHWVQHDEPGRVNELMIKFLRAAPRR